MFRVTISLVIAFTLVGCADRIIPADVVFATHIPDYFVPDNSKTHITNHNKQQIASKVVIYSKSALEQKEKKYIWHQPTHGWVKHKFSTILHGVDYAGVLGQDIYATRDGKVVYSGNALKEYGNLLIIKHDNHYLSAYAYNKKNLVHEGQFVHAGDKIATMGQDLYGNNILHFEIRYLGKAIDPLQLIKE